jgi:hypothetical protein
MATALDFLRHCDTAQTKFGTLTAMDWPSNQASCQNFSVLPLPSTVVTEAWNKVEVEASSLNGSHDHE